MGSVQRQSRREAAFLFSLGLLGGRQIGRSNRRLRRSRMRWVRDIMDEFDRSHAPRGNAATDALRQRGRGASWQAFPRRAWERSIIGHQDGTVRPLRRTRGISDTCGFGYLHTAIIQPAKGPSLPFFRRLVLTQIPVQRLVRRTGIPGDLPHVPLDPLRHQVPHRCLDR